MAYFVMAHIVMSNAVSYLKQPAAPCHMDTRIHFCMDMCIDMRTDMRQAWWPLEFVIATNA